MGAVDNGVSTRYIQPRAAFIVESSQVLHAAGINPYAPDVGCIHRRLLLYRKDAVYSPFLLAAFGAIAVLVRCRRRDVPEIRVHEIPSQAFFVGGASEAPKPS